MKHAGQLILFWLIVSAANAATTITNKLSISPAKPTASWDVTLPAQVSACLSVLVVRAENGYTLKSRGNQPNQPNEFCTLSFVQDQDFIWVGTLSSSSSKDNVKGEFLVGNTSQSGVRTVVRVACTWEKAGGGDGRTGIGADGDGGPQEIEGLATGTASKTSSAVSWQFDRTVQVADGESQVQWKVEVFNSLGVPVPVTFNSIKAANSAPWTIKPPGGSGSSLSGNVTSSDASTDNLRVFFSGADGSPSTAETVLRFFESPMQVIQGNFIQFVDGKPEENAWVAIWNKLALGDNQPSARNKTVFVKGATTAKDLAANSLPSADADIRYVAAINGNFYVLGGNPRECKVVCGFVGTGDAPWMCGNSAKNLGDSGKRWGVGFSVEDWAHLVAPDIETNNGYFPAAVVRAKPYGLNNVGLLVSNGNPNYGYDNWPGTRRPRSLLVWSREGKHFFMVIIGHGWGQGGTSWDETISFVMTSFRESVRQRLPDFEVGDAIMLDGGTSTQLSFRRQSVGLAPLQVDWVNSNWINVFGKKRAVPTLVNTYATIP